MSRKGRGTLVRQREGANWFHFAIPAETMYQEHDEGFPGGHQLKSVTIRAELNENAIITDVHVWEEDDRLRRFPETGGDGEYGLDIRDGEVFETFDIGGHELGVRSSGLVVCIRVAFLDGETEGSVLFKSAGARIYHRYHA